MVMVDQSYCNSALTCYLLVSLILLLPFVSELGALRIREENQQCFVLIIKASNVLLDKLFHKYGNAFKKGATSTCIELSSSIF